MQEIKTMMWVGGCHNDWKRNGKDGGHIADSPAVFQLSRAIN